MDGPGTDERLTVLAVQRALDIVSEAAAMVQHGPGLIGYPWVTRAAMLLARADGAVNTARTVLHTETGEPLPDDRDRPPPVPGWNVYQLLWDEPWSDMADELVCRELLYDLRTVDPDVLQLDAEVVSLGEVLNRYHVAEPALSGWVRRALQTDEHLAADQQAQREGR